MMETRIERIRRMEEAFDRLRSGADPDAAALLRSYMDSGQWLLDYMADERGELPPDLKRGVLSQDGLYNLLTEISEKGMFHD